MVQRTCFNKGKFTELGTWEEFKKLTACSLKTGFYKISSGNDIYLRWINRSRSVTVVVFAAAVGNGVKRIPIFAGERLAESVDANFLLISDPSLEIDSSLKIAWYIGNRQQPNLVSVLTRIIASFQGTGRIVLFGGSGGGFSALVQNPRLKNSIAFVANPTTDIRRRPSDLTPVR